jgi:pimeloyl-ACP methyl ester carboxylesterase
MVVLQIVVIVIAVVLLGRALNLVLLIRWYSKPKPPGETLLVNDKRIYYTIKGQGSPTVVIEAGLGSASAEWWQIQDTLAQSARVLTYDRAGYGWSELRHDPRTSRQIAFELKALLDTLKIEPPYILVGHSQGGLYINHFCRLYPDLVAGIVLVDPVSPDDVRFKQELLPRVYKRSGVDKTKLLKVQGWLSGFGFLRLMRPFLFKSPSLAPYRALPAEAFSACWHNFLAPKTSQTALNEYLRARDPRNIVDLKNSGSPPSVPLRVLVHDAELMRNAIMRHGDLSRDDADKVENLWQELLQANTTLSSKGKVVQTSSGSHLIHLTQPDVVVQNVLDMVKAER